MPTINIELNGLLKSNSSLEKRMPAQINGRHSDLDIDNLLSNDEFFSFTEFASCYYHIINTRFD